MTSKSIFVNHLYSSKEGSIYSVIAIENDRIFVKCISGEFDTDEREISECSLVTFFSIFNEIDSDFKDDLSTYKWNSNYPPVGCFIAIKVNETPIKVTRPRRYVGSKEDLVFITPKGNVYTGDFEWQHC